MLLLLFAQMKVGLEWYVPMKEMWEKALPCKCSLMDVRDRQTFTSLAVLWGGRGSECQWYIIVSLSCLMHFNSIRDNGLFGK